jgi:hypothetical protein
VHVHDVFALICSKYSPCRLSLSSVPSVNLKKIMEFVQSLAFARHRELEPAPPHPIKNKNKNKMPLKIKNSIHIIGII